jgi:hypothetical protein
MLPMMSAVPGRTTHDDYVRHSITSLFAALDVATGTMIGQLTNRKLRRSVHRSTVLEADVKMRSRRGTQTRNRS